MDDQEVITISDEEDDDCIVVSSSIRARVNEGNSGQNLPGSSVQRIRGHRPDVVDDHPNEGPNLMEQHQETHEERMGQEGRRLNGITNAIIIPKDWTSFEVAGQDVVVFGGDDQCVQELMRANAQSALVFKTFECEGFASQVLALSSCSNIQWIPSPAAGTSSSSPSWPLWRDVNAVGEPFHVLILSLQSSTEETEIDSLKIQEVYPVEGGKYSVKRTIERTIDSIFYTDSFADLSSHKYSLAAVQSIYSSK
ncbi:hypothetical protein PMAYCL1PPCAC_30260 [Pristionchus mayeri]|uniref:Uncharacterized protein n=1 Tax=Pristionchus mayeri TaxID=1317129 RepID=A0AAN5DCD0_9BILA|nr:hypothetical protein PMAYCL1PPCAC_30260 [Pristionchus mayeri]